VRAALWLGVPGETAPRVPVTIVPIDTLAALGILTGALLVFWSCRRICETGGTGRIVRSVALIGLVGSIAAIVQHSQSQELIYGVWRPLDAGARPFGPFVNRNHFATWVVMACPLVFGYLLARVPTGHQPRLVSQRIAMALAQLGSMRIWLAASVCVMTLALLISASRSGLIAAMCAIVVSLALRTRSAQPGIRNWTVFQGVVLVLVALSFANFDALAKRVDQTLGPSELGRGRSAIWTDALVLIRDFPLTGLGAGTFGAGIAVYQTAEPGYSIGNAHNHYLQLAAEGGLLVGVPAALTLGAFIALCGRRLREDGSGDYLVRAGAVAGIVAVLVQSVWETGLRMPANAMLLAVLSAIATHSAARRTTQAATGFSRDHLPC
jgi:O-antigen ligase